MRLIRNGYNLKYAKRGCVATIGNFDGVHLGHRAVLQRLKAQGAALGLPTTVIIFEPQPLEFFQQATAPPRLMRLREKLTALAQEQIDQVLLLRFDSTLAAMRARPFIQQLLVDGLGVRFLLIGDDFRFGDQREGDFKLLTAMGREHNFVVANLAGIRLGQERISSTRVREALARGDLEQARHLLGRPYTMSGRVVYGDQRGRTIGFPTANLWLHRRVSPLHGVFAVRVHGVDDQPWPGVANIGTRPTVGGDAKERLEVHLFDCQRTLYGKKLEVEMLLKLRDEQHFVSFEALKEQIVRDAQAARDYLFGTKSDLCVPPPAAATH